MTLVQTKCEVDLHIMSPVFISKFNVSLFVLECNFAYFRLRKNRIQDDDHIHVYETPGAKLAPHLPTRNEQSIADGTSPQQSLRMTINTAYGSYDASS